ncbi:hypothetical protein LWI29_023170 [Acer saccharum]|uniref:Uncharacterized protein n=1 Tax=Acer saccharum TaxID=4024 RepID=A0AA39T539_ACESA|nr:hypothetical protein LWI29_023170 [Acer saccharum]
MCSQLQNFLSSTEDCGQTSAEDCGETSAEVLSLEFFRRLQQDFCKRLRDLDALTLTGSQFNFSMDVLNDQETWNLFSTTAGDCVEQSDLQVLAKKVAKACGEIFAIGKEEDIIDLKELRSMTLEGLSKLTSFCSINNNGVILEDTPTATFNGKNDTSSEEDTESSEEDGAGPSEEDTESSEEDGAGPSTQHQVLQNTESSEEDGAGLSTQHLVLKNEESYEEDGAGPSMQHLEMPIVLKKMALVLPRHLEFAVCSLQDIVVHNFQFLKGDFGTQRGDGGMGFGPNGSSWSANVDKLQGQEEVGSQQSPSEVICLKSDLRISGQVGSQSLSVERSLKSDSGCQTKE